MCGKLYLLGIGTILWTMTSLAVDIIVIEIIGVLPSVQFSCLNVLSGCWFLKKKNQSLSVLRIIIGPIYTLLDRIMYRVFKSYYRQRPFP